MHLHLFDLLHLDGWDLRQCTLLERKRVLQGLNDWRGMLRYSDHQVGNAAGMLREVSKLGLEGIICKQAEAPYRAGRGRDWLKIKCLGREEFIVLGWTPPGGSRTAWVRCILAITISEGGCIMLAASVQGFPTMNSRG